MDRKQRKPPKPLKILVNLFAKNKNNSSSSSNNGDGGGRKSEGVDTRELRLRSRKKKYNRLL